MRDAAWLQFWGGKMLRQFASSPVSIIDVRPRAAYDQGHVPFAVSMPSEVFESNLANPRKITELLSQAGVDPSQEAVVVTGAGLTKESALAFAIFERLKQKKVSVFMDSMEKSAELGLAPTKDPTVAGPKKNPGDLAVPVVKYPFHVRLTVITSRSGIDGENGRTRTCPHQGPDGRRPEKEPRRPGRSRREVSVPRPPDCDHFQPDARRISQSVCRLGQEPAHAGSGRQDDPGAVHGPAECRRHSQGRQRHLENPQQGWRPTICAVGFRFR